MKGLPLQGKPQSSPAAGRGGRRLGPGQPSTFVGFSLGAPKTTEQFAAVMAKGTRGGIWKLAAKDDPSLQAGGSFATDPQPRFVLCCDLSARALHIPHTRPSFWQERQHKEPLKIET